VPPIGLPDWLYPGIVVQPISWGSEVRTEFTPETRIQAWVTAIVVDQSSLYVHFRDFRYAPEENRSVVSGPTITMPASEFVQTYQPRPSAYGSRNYVFSAMQDPESLGPGAIVAQRGFFVDVPDPPYLEETTSPSPERVEPVPPKTEEPDRLQLLNTYMNLCELSCSQANADLPPNRKAQVMSLVREVARQLGLSPPSSGDDPYTIYREALDLLEKLLIHKEPETGLRSRFEREPLV
jgi:hypothetical protein